MKHNIYFIMAVMTAMILSIGSISCSNDDDENGGSDSQSFLIGEWHECDALGNFINDATGSEVMHLKFISNYKGEWWSVTRGKKDSHWYSFDYTYKLEGTSLELTQIITASSNSLEVGITETTRCTYINGILHGGEIYYKKIGEIDERGETGGGDIDKTYALCPDGHHPHMIDLGLPSGTKWACCNVGAKTPEGYGNHYAWGETKPKGSYKQENYQYYNGNLSNPDCWINIGSDIANTDCDAATANWGSPWHMPLLSQINELRVYSTSTWTTLSGVNGRMFTGANGGTIFLPACGGYFSSSSRSHFGLVGYYLSSTLYPSYDKMNYPEDAYGLQFTSDHVYWDYDCYRIYGMSVRPVQ